MTVLHRMRRRVLAATVAATTAAALAISSAPAQADTSPSPAGNPANPETVSATPLPTVQMNGVAWSQAIIGNTVYVAGEFSQARPAGSPAGSNETPRANLLAYDIRTGELIQSWAPITNAPVLVIKASPDGSRLYIGGQFTQVNGLWNQRIAALDATTGALIPDFAPRPDASVRAIAVTSQTVYFGGYFGVAGGQTRYRLAAVSASTGALLDWAPQAEDGVWSLVASPDGSKILAGGQFLTMNGSDNPGRGLAALDAVTGQNLPWAANTSLVRNGGDSGGISALYTDGAYAYAAGWTYGRSGGTLEGVAKMAWGDGSVDWLQDCHGDSYGISSDTDVVYVVTHAHYCGNVPGGFHDTSPRTWFRGVAFSKQPTQTLLPEYSGYTNFAGTPAPSLLQWLPDLVGGTFTGIEQAAWTVENTSDYVVAGGEFPRVGNMAQYGLVRFAKKGVAGNPNNTGGEFSGAAANPVVTSPGAGEALVTWRTNFDRDSEFLTYSVMRNGSTTPAKQVTVRSNAWERQYLSFLDTGLPQGSVSYRIFATDPDGNEVRSNSVSTTVVAGSQRTDGYARTVLADGPMHYWRMGDPSGTALSNLTGLEDATAFGGVTLGTGGVVPSDTAATFSGSSSQTASTLVQNPSTQETSVEAWFRTTTNTGGKIVGMGNRTTGASTTFDRHLYMDNSGRVYFGVRQGVNVVVNSSAGLNDGEWHHAVGTVGDDGLELYIDGARVDRDSNVRTGRSYDSYWRIGGDSLSGWTNRPSSDYFNGTIDEVAVYAHQLTGTEVSQHFSAATTPNVAPTAGFTSTVANQTVSFTSTASDSDGVIVSHAWQFGDGTTSTEVNPTKTYSTPGTYSVTLTVTDDNGATDSITQPVSTVQIGETALATDDFARSVSSGWGSAPIGGAWNLAGGSTVFDVSGGTGNFGLTSPGSTSRATLGSLGVSDTDSTVTFGLDKVPNGGGAYVSLAARASGDGNDAYRAKVRVAADGRVSLFLVRVISGGQADIATPIVLPTSASYAVGDRLQLRLQAVGSSPTTVRAKVWKVGSAEPSAWQLSATDSTAALQGAGGVGVVTYLSGATTNQPVAVRFDDLEADAVGDGQNETPTASFTSSVSDLTVAFTSTSSDPDGTIASHAWDFGDGTTSTAVNPTKTYSTPGTYTVSLTVTDDDGARASVSHQVTVQAGSTLADDDFARTVAGGWGSAPIGGAWNLTGGSTVFDVSGGTGNFGLTSPGTTSRATLGALAAADTDATVTFGLDKVPNGGGAYVSLASRASANGNDAYRAKVRVAADGQLSLFLVRVISGGQTDIATPIVLPTSENYTVGDRLQLRLQTEGSSPTTVRAKVWKVGSAEPSAWQLTATDSTAALQGAGGVGVVTYLSGATTNNPVAIRFDDLAVTRIGG